MHMHNSGLSKRTKTWLISLMLVLIVIGFVATMYWETGDALWLGGLVIVAVAVGQGMLMWLTRDQRKPRQETEYDTAALRDDATYALSDDGELVEVYDEKTKRENL